MPGSRKEYEQAVRDLRREADDLLARGASIEFVARIIVNRRNGLKATFRQGMDPVVLTFIEARNTARYGNPLGPRAGFLLLRYGDWDKVIDAACRPAQLSGE